MFDAQAPCGPEGIYAELAPASAKTSRPARRPGPRVRRPESPSRAVSQGTPVPAGPWAAGDLGSRVVPAGRTSNGVHDADVPRRHLRATRRYCATASSRAAGDVDTSTSRRSRRHPRAANGVRIHGRTLQFRDGQGTIPRAGGQPCAHRQGVLCDGEPPDDGPGVPGPHSPPTGSGPSATTLHLLRALHKPPRRRSYGCFVVGAHPGCLPARALLRASLLAARWESGAGPRGAATCSATRQHRLHTRHRGRAARSTSSTERIGDEYLLDPMRFGRLGAGRGRRAQCRPGRSVVISSAVSNGISDDKLVYACDADDHPSTSGEAAAGNVVPSGAGSTTDEEVLDRIDELVVNTVEGPATTAYVFGPGEASEKELATVRRSAELTRGWIIPSPSCSCRRCPPRSTACWRRGAIDLRPFGQRR